VPFLTTQGKHNRNCSVHIDRVAIEQCWLIAPLLDSVHCALHQQRWARDVLEVLHRPVLPDNRMKQYGSGNMRSLRDRWICR
jgi:hypothetical protein